MAYQALYRKYRPATFEEMAGQKQIVQTLQNAISRDRISHAYLFCGPRGTGKTSAAKIFARALNCTSEGTRPCGQCENCQAEDHPDIIEIDAASNNGVEEARNLVERVKYAPMLGKYKVYIIDEVHMMTAGAFNALLKTIEEPPAHVVFILATTEPHKVLPTILSRCQRFDFKKVPSEQIEERLLQIADAEGTTIDKEAAETIASLSDGGLRDALSILDQCLAYEPNHLTAEDVRSVYGVVSPEDLASLFLDLSAGDADAVLQRTRKLYDDGMDLEQFTADLITMLKDSLILQHSPDTTLLQPDRKELITGSFLRTPAVRRKRLLADLMDVYPKYSRASSVLDYLEGVLLRYLEDPTDMNAENLPETDSSANMNSQKYEKSENLKKDRNQKKGQIKKNGSDSESDVSRETSAIQSESETNHISVRYSEDDIVGLLHTADKKYRKTDVEGWKKRNEFLHSLNYGKFANLVKNAAVAASGSDYLIVNTGKRLEVSAMNAMQEECGFEEFLERLTGVRKKLIAITNDEYKKAVERFRECMKEGSFPNPPKIMLKDRTESSHSQTEEEALKAIFPNLKIIDD